MSTSSYRHLLWRTHLIDFRQRYATFLVCLVISAGGIIGALSRYQLSCWWPMGLEEFPWTTMIINVSGCALMGIVMVLVDQRWKSSWRFLQPFIGTGFLGGYTTFSSFSKDVYTLLNTHHDKWAFLYLLGTPLAALTATALADRITRYVLSRSMR